MKNFFKKIGEGVKAVANKASLFAVAALSIVFPLERQILCPLASPAR